MPITRQTKIDVITSKLGNTTSNVIDGSQSVSITGSGIVAVQSYQVHNIRGTKDGILINACYAGGIPRHGNPHPKITGIWVTSVVAKLIEMTPDGAVVTVTWGVPNTGGGSVHFNNEPSGDAVPTLEVSGTLQSMPTNLDVDGKIITVSKIITDEEAQTSREDIQGVTVELQVPMLVLVYRRRETIVTTVDSKDVGFAVKSKMFKGTINSVPLFDSGIHTWLCSNIHGVSDDGQQTMNVTYEFMQAPQRFENREETWDATAVYQDSNGRPDKNAVLGDGIVDNIRVLRETDFTLLQLGLI